MNRRKFLQLTGMALAVPAIGLPVVTGPVIDYIELVAHGRGAPIMDYSLIGKLAISECSLVINPGHNSSQVSVEIGGEIIDSKRVLVEAANET